MIPKSGRFPAKTGGIESLPGIILTGSFAIYILLITYALLNKNIVLSVNKMVIRYS